METAFVNLSTFKAQLAFRLTSVQLSQLKWLVTKVTGSHVTSTETFFFQ